MLPDYPAAHSMDTDWFAVDGDGHVAHFQSHESGAVPRDALREEGHETLLDLKAALPVTVAQYELKGWLTVPERDSDRHLWRPGESYQALIVLFLKSSEMVRDDIEAGRAALLEGTEGVPVFYRILPGETAGRIHGTGLCLGCFLDFCNHDERDAPNPARLGLFSYHHVSENWISGPYGRRKRPQTPVLIDDLPQPFGDKIRRMEFSGLCFADELHIQPVDLVACDSFEDAYLGSDGRTVRPLPGKERQYKDYYDEVLRNVTGLDVQPPRDYPAAHSMDTDWFAVDECGHVALCSSGEAGAVPEGAVSTETADIEDRGKMIPAPLAEAEPSHLNVLARVFEGIHTAGWADYDFDIFAHRPVEPLVQRLRAEEFILEYAPDRVVIRLKKGDKQAGLRDFIHERALCLCCGHVWWEDQGPWQFPNGMRTFFYSAGGVGTAAPYLLAFMPKIPAVLDRVPLTAKLRDAMRTVRIGGCFRDRLFWQPAETQTCSLYGGQAFAIRPQGIEFERTIGGGYYL